MRCSGTDPVPHSVGAPFGAAAGGCAGKEHHDREAIAPDDEVDPTTQGKGASMLERSAQVNSGVSVRHKRSGMGMASAATDLNAMIRRATLSVLLFSAGCSPFALRAASLHADGRLRVEGASWQGTRVLVVPANGEAYAFEPTSTRFTIELQYRDRYLLSFEREGCPTKQILFDTHVPDNMVSREFDFPFQVTLAYLPEGKRFIYDGPVGFVRYSPEEGDFTYTTQYGIKEQDRMVDRLEVLRMTPMSISGSSGRPGSSLAPGTLIRKEVVTEVMEAGAAVPPMARTTLERMDPRIPVMAHRPLSLPPLRARGSVLGTTPASGAVALKVPVIASPGMGTPSPLAAIPATPVEVEPQCGTHAVSVEPRRVTYVTRSALEGRCTELRKVVHAYGGVFFFRDGTSITEGMYAEAMNAHPVPLARP